MIGIAKAMRRMLATAGLALSALALPISAGAQQNLFVPDVASVPNFAGVGIAVLPDYEGSNDATFGIGPMGRLSFGNRYLMLRGNELSANLLDHPFLRLGPVATLRLGRKDVDDALVARMSDISTTVELGLTAGLDFTNEANSRIRFTTSLDVTGDVGGVSDGFLVDWSASYWHPLAKPLDFALIGGMTYASGNFMDTYFGVDAGDSAASGLSQFSATSGLKDIRIASMFVFHFNRNWHLGAGVMYKRLLNDAADSPVVDDRGSADQLLAVVAGIYSW